ncbi:unnamed protein product, partial [Brassica rapa subsp. trilocularis]
MCHFSTNIHFDYDGHYSKAEDDYEWIPTDARLYAISFKTSTLEEITYSLLKERVCRKMGIDPLTKRLNLGYIPLVECIRDQRRSILHVEDIQELQIVQITEQLSRVGESSCSRNYSECESGYGEEENVGTIRTPGMPSKCWSGVGITELISKTNQSPYHSYYRCIYAASLRLDYQVRMLEEEVQFLK